VTYIEQPGIPLDGVKHFKVTARVPEATAMRLRERVAQERAAFKGQGRRPTESNLVAWAIEQALAAPAEAAPAASPPPPPPAPLPPSPPPPAPTPPAPTKNDTGPQFNMKNFEERWAGHEVAPPQLEPDAESKLLMAQDRLRRDIRRDEASREMLALRIDRGLVGWVHEQAAARDEAPSATLEKILRDARTLERANSSRRAAASGSKAKPAPALVIPASSPPPSNPSSVARGRSTQRRVGANHEASRQPRGAAGGRLSTEDAPDESGEEVI
jgi:hypothetical protein